MTHTLKILALSIPALLCACDTEPMRSEYAGEVPSSPMYKQAPNDNAVPVVAETGQLFGPCDFDGYGDPAWTGCADPSTVCDISAEDPFLSICVERVDPEGVLAVDIPFLCPQSVEIDGEEALVAYNNTLCQIPCTPGTGSRECPSTMECSSEGTCAWPTEGPACDACRPELLCDWTQPIEPCGPVSPISAGESFGPCNHDPALRYHWCNQPPNGTRICAIPQGFDVDASVCLPRLLPGDCANFVLLPSGNQVVGFHLFQDPFANTCTVSCIDTTECPLGMQCLGGMCAWPT